MIVRYNKLEHGLKFTKLNEKLSVGQFPTVYTKMSHDTGIDDNGYTVKVEENEQVFRLKRAKVNV